MKKWRVERFEQWFKENRGEDKMKFIVNHDGLEILTEKEILSKVFHFIDIENDCSILDHSSYIEQFSTSCQSMVSLYNEFIENSGDHMYITNINNFSISELLGADTDLDYDKLKNLSFEEIQKIQEDEDQDAWIIWDLKVLGIK